MRSHPNNLLLLRERPRGRRKFQIFVQSTRSAGHQPSVHPTPIEQSAVDAPVADAVVPVDPIVVVAPVRDGSATVEGVPVADAIRRDDFG